MSMRTHIRAMAHEKAKQNGIRKMNKPRRNPQTGKPIPSWFAMNWRRAAEAPIPGMKKQEKTKAVAAQRRRKRTAA